MSNIPQELFNKLASFNASMNAIHSDISEVAQASSFLQKLLLKKSTEAQIMEAFAELEEKKWEQASTRLAKIPQRTLQEVLNANESLKATADSFLGKIKQDEEAQEEAILQNAVRTYAPQLSSGADLQAYSDAVIKAERNDPFAFEPLPESSSEVEEEAIITDYDAEDDNGEEDIDEEIKLKEGRQESFALNIVLNEKQLAGKELAMQGKSFCFIGPAGTGKTTGQRAVAEALLQDNRLETSRFKTYSSTGERVYVSAPSIAFCAFTRRAAANLRKAIHKSPLLAEELKHNIMTIHALLEFEPVTYEDYDDEGKLVQKFRFLPQRTAQNPLNITHLVIEEASMLDAYTLWKQLYDALPSGVQIIFIGDINQLPPVFGPSILNYALVQLPIVELTQVYRNQGIVLENAHNILKGKKLEEDQNFVIVRGKSPTQVGQAKLAASLAGLFNKWLDVTGSDGLPEYDPEDCMILSPFNKQECGTINLNNWIAQHLGTRRGAVVHEIIAGFNKLYLAVGDRVMVNRMDGVITDIYRNPSYHGKEPQIAGKNLTRFGMRILGEADTASFDDIALDYSTFSLDALANEKAERKQQASHTVKVQLDNGQVEELSATGDFGDQSFSLGYALTVHKAQGSEWRKVFIILHKDHATMLYRELFYTAVTRARTKVTIIAKDNVIDKAIGNQRIKGNTIADKIEYFNSGVMNNHPEPIYTTKE